jgi:membrane-associated phospholipid phosphatase
LPPRRKNRDRIAARHVRSGSIGIIPEIPVGMTVELGGLVEQPPHEDSVLHGRGWSALHPRVRLLLAATIAVSIPLLTYPLRAAPLPYDHEFAAVLFLMWPRSGLGFGLAEVAIAALELACFGVPLLLVMAAALPNWMLRTPPPPLRWAYRYALVVPVLALAVTTVSRLVSNAVYATAPLVSWDLTGPIARLEGGLISGLQRALENTLLNDVCAALYAGGWLITLLAAVPALMMFGRDRGAGRLAIGWVICAISAAPFFALLPVFEPWAFNPAYGYVGPHVVDVRFLAATSDLPELRRIATHLRWAAGSCFPSLHVALPVLASVICFHQRVSLLGWAYLALACLTGFSVVYLGRHWIIDVPAGALFGVVVGHFCARVRPERLLFLPGVIERG